MSSRERIACTVTDRCYGGPEEGGWWYDSTIVLDVRRARGKARNRRIMREFRRRYSHLGDDRPLSSVLSTGRVYIQILPADYVAELRRMEGYRPHYE